MSVRALRNAGPTQARDLVQRVAEPIACDLPRPEGPGLGGEIDEALVIERARSGCRRRNPQWRHNEGSVTEW